jgi:hypothetical protein
MASEFHYYIFYLDGGDPIPVYERTTGNESAARYRCDELNERGKHPLRGAPQPHHAFYTVNCLPKEFWY